MAPNVIDGREDADEGAESNAKFENLNGVVVRGPVFSFHFFIIQMKMKVIQPL